MTNEKTKQKVSFWLDRSLVAQLDGLCARDRRTRTELVIEALERFFDVYEPTAELKKLEELEVKFEEMKMSQIEGNKQLLEIVARAIKEQPIIQQSLPPVEEPKPKKSLLKRLFS